MSVRQQTSMSPSLGFTSRQVTVSAITPDGQVAVCIDKTGVEVRVPLLWSRAKGLLPAPGENWIVSQDFGRWSFAMFLGTSPGSFVLSGGGGSSGIDWINVKNSPFNAAGNGIVDDTSAIQEALNAATAGQVVYLPTGTYLINAPLTMKDKTHLRGPTARATGSLSGNTQGAVLKPGPGFSRGSAAVNAMIVLPDGTNGISVEHLMIDGSALVSPPDGIASVDQAQGVSLHDITMYKVCNGINQTWSVHRCDGWNIQNVLIQSNTGVGVIETGNDMFVSNVHAQNCGLDCWQISGFHPQHYGCRGDVSAAGSGVVWDLAIGGNPLDSGLWIGGGTQLNARYGMDISNSRASAKSAPVSITGATIDGDTLGGVRVAGPNMVTLTGVNILMGPSSVPPYALITDFGSDGTSPPDIISAGGGSLWNAATAPVHDNAGVGAQILIGHEVVYANSIGLTGYTRRTSTISTNASNGTTPVTVNNSWVTPSSRITVSWLPSSAPAGIPYVASRSAGSFTVASTSAADTSLLMVWTIT